MLYKTLRNNAVFSGVPGSCVDIDECASQPCMNGAICGNWENYYDCSCLPGYTGINCETNIDECIGYPCLNGAM